MSVLPVSLQAQRLSADFSYARFYAPDQGSYLETYMNFSGATVMYVPQENGMYQGKLELTYAFIKNDSIITYSKQEVLSPQIVHPDSGVIDFIDVQRIQVAPGDYELMIALRDIEAGTPPYRASQPITIEDKSKEIAFSDIEMIDIYMSGTGDPHLSKGGATLYPYVFDFYPTERTELRFYTELYNTVSTLGDEPFLIRYSVQNTTTLENMDLFGGFKKMMPQPVNSFYAAMDISELPSGHYRLEVACVNAQNVELTKTSIGFERLNQKLDMQALQAKLDGVTFEGHIMSINNSDSLREMVFSLNPISTRQEQIFITNTAKTAGNEALQNFIIDFWSGRNPADPKSAWLQYTERVQAVNNDFGTLRTPGYDTDRGTVYLKYGPPNTISKRENEPSAYPYHIWHYYKHPRRSDAKYVFYNPNMASNDYQLLHSNVIGELNNRRWQRDLQIRNTPFGTVDDENTNGEYGSWSDDLFQIPR